MKKRKKPIDGVAMTLRDMVKSAHKAGCKIDFELRPMDYEKVVMQRDQVLHLLRGGHLTPGQVADSGLGQGVLIELNHEAHKRKCAEHCLELAMAALDDIATMPRQRRARSVAVSCVEFIKQMRLAVHKKNSK